MTKENTHLRKIIGFDDLGPGTPNGKTFNGGKPISSYTNLDCNQSPIFADRLLPDEISENEGSVQSDMDDLSAIESVPNSRPTSQRSKKTLRQVSSLLFISTPTSSHRRKLEDLDSSTLIDLIKDYMEENEALRKENYDLLTVRDMIMRDQEMVCIENERLLRKLEELDSSS